MRWFISLLLVAVVLSASVPLLKGLSAVLAGRGQGAPAGPSAGSSPAVRATRPSHSTVRVTRPDAVTVYRWRDADGTVHFESAPPANGAEVDTQVETIEMQRGPTVEVLDAPAPERGAGAAPGLTSNPLSVYSAEGMDELMRTLDGTAQTLDERRRVMRELEQDL